MILWAIPSSSDTSSWVQPHSNRPIILPRKKSSKCGNLREFIRAPGYKDTFELSSRNGKKAKRIKRKAGGVSKVRVPGAQPSVITFTLDCDDSDPIPPQWVPMLPAWKEITEA
ncbi:hypothetical protein TNCV_4427101 [Trichonephila clavipes]|nr:hypothetical protein TNCV_4427101 [Trichonephila clavipes]